MDKHELIENIKAHGEWCKELYTGEKDRYIKISKVKDLIEQQTKPAPVEVPEFVAEWIDRDKKSGRTVYGTLTRLDKEAGVIAPRNVAEWVFQSNDHQELFIRAWLDGYTVAKELSWLVIGDRGYLTSLNIGKGFSTGWTGNNDKYDSGAIHFIDHQRAIDVAKLVGGEVVPVEGEE